MSRAPSMRRLATVAGVFLLAATAAAIPAGAAPVAAKDGAQTLYKTPGRFTLTVPAGMTSLHVEAIGAGGGGGGGGGAGPSFFDSKPKGGGGAGGGGGAYTVCTVPVKPGEKLTVHVPGGASGSAGGNQLGGGGYSGDDADAAEITNSSTDLIYAEGGKGGDYGGGSVKGGVPGHSVAGGNGANSDCNGKDTQGISGSKSEAGGTQSWGGQTTGGYGGGPGRVISGCEPAGWGGSGGNGAQQPESWGARGENGKNGCIAVTFKAQR